MDTLKQIHISEEKVFENTVFPLTLAPPGNVQTVEDAVLFVTNNLDILKKKVLTHGAILFRGFPINSPKDFNDFALAFGWKDLPYIGGAAVRTQIHGVVFTSNESPPDKAIPFHHEMAQVPKFPSHLFFYCDVPASEGGETPICLSNRVYEQVNKEMPEFAQKLLDKGVKYTRIIPEEDDPTSAIGRGWKSTFLTQEKSVAEERCKSHGGDFEWLPDGNLKTVTNIMPAIRMEERTGKFTWFNSIVAAYFGWKDQRNDPTKAITFGDDTLLNSAHVLRTNEILDENAVSFKWEKNDVILIDNRLVLHARKSFIPPRKILAALFQ